MWGGSLNFAYIGPYRSRVMSKIRILNIFFQGCPSVLWFLWNHDFWENWLGSLSRQLFHGKSGSGSKFQYIIFLYWCHDIGWNAHSFKNTVYSKRFMVLSKWALFCYSSSFAWFVLDLVWTLVWLEKIKCSRGAGRYGGGTARRGAAWTFNFFHENCTWVCFLCFVCTGPSMSPTAREQKK